MAAYKIIHIGNRWIVVADQVELISFDRKAKAVGVVRAAVRLSKTQSLRRAQQRFELKLLAKRA